MLKRTLLSTRLPCLVMLRTMVLKRTLLLTRAPCLAEGMLKTTVLKPILLSTGPLYLRWKKRQHPDRCELWLGKEQC